MDEWNKGRIETTTESKVEKFLSSNKGKAFSQVEIVTNLYPTKSDSLTETFQQFGYLIIVKTTLDALIKQGTIKAKSVKKEIGTETYYTTV